MDYFSTAQNSDTLWPTRYIDPLIVEHLWDYVGRPLQASDLSAETKFTGIV